MKLQAALDKVNKLEALASSTQFKSEAKICRQRIAAIRERYIIPEVELAYTKFGESDPSLRELSRLFKARWVKERVVCGPLDHPPIPPSPPPIPPPRSQFDDIDWTNRFPLDEELKIEDLFVYLDWRRKILAKLIRFFTPSKFQESIDFFIAFYICERYGLK
jgi:hypothetical protein